MIKLIEKPLNAHYQEFGHACDEFFLMLGRIPQQSRAVIDFALDGDLVPWMPANYIGFDAPQDFYDPSACWFERTLLVKTNGFASLDAEQELQVQKNVQDVWAHLYRNFGDGTRHLNPTIMRLIKDQEKMLSERRRMKERTRAYQTRSL